MESWLTQAGKFCCTDLCFPSFLASYATFSVPRCGDLCLCSAPILVRRCLFPHTFDTANRTTLTEPAQPPPPPPSPTGLQFHRREGKPIHDGCRKRLAKGASESHIIPGRSRHSNSLCIFWEFFGSYVLLRMYFLGDFLGGVNGLRDPIHAGVKLAVEDGGGGGRCK